MKYFARIVKSGYDRNGNSIRKVFIYKALGYKPEEFNYISSDEVKSLDFGKVYKAGHFIRTQLRKDEIITRLQNNLKDVNYIFE